MNMKIIYLCIALLFLFVPANAQFLNPYFNECSVTGNCSVYTSCCPTHWATVATAAYCGTCVESTGGVGDSKSAFMNKNAWMSQEVCFDNNYNITFWTRSPSGGQTIEVYANGILLYSAGTSVGGVYHSVNTTSLSGFKTIKFNTPIASGYTYVDNIILSDHAPINELIIGGSSSSQSWYVNQTDYPDLDVYFQEIVDYQIEDFNVSRDYYINCTSSNASHPYTYNYFIDDNNGDSTDNSIYFRMGMETKILYPDSPTTYTFHLYEINENIKDSFPWYYWLIYPLYMLVEMFADDSGVVITELDTIAITLSKVSGDNETQPDIPEEPEEPDIPDPEPDPDPDSDPYVPPDPPDINDTAGNQTVNVSFTDGYYQTVNSTIDGFFSPVYNFTNWSCSPVTQLSSTISDFSNDMEGGFDFADSKIGLVSGAFSCVFSAFPPKIVSMISFFLVLMVLLIIMGRDKN